MAYLVIIPWLTFSHRTMAYLWIIPRRYVLSLVGMVPGIVTYVYIGAAVADAAHGGEGGGGGGDGGGVDALRLVLLIVGAVAALLAAIAISYFARRELRKSIDMRGGVVTTIAAL